MEARPCLKKSPHSTYDYSDFGEVTLSGEAAIENEICYTGAVYDASTGLHYLNARYYDPENGRFISQDSYRGELDEIQQWHLYAYCANNPINYTDPSGHLRKHWWNSTKWVARFIDAAIIVIGGWKVRASKKVMINFLKKYRDVIGRRAKKKLEKMLNAAIRNSYLDDAIDIALVIMAISIGESIAQGLDYVDSWWGYKRGNGYILN